MPRQARIDAPGALQHIIIRGIQRKAILKNQTDRQDFIDRLGNLLPDTQTACYAWALMTNHVHLLLRTGTTTISTPMQRLLTGYAVTFNRRHKRHGHLFPPSPPPPTGAHRSQIEECRRRTPRPSAS